MYAFVPCSFHLQQEPVDLGLSTTEQELNRKHTERRDQWKTLLILQFTWRRFSFCVNALEPRTYLTLFVSHLHVFQYSLQISKRPIAHKHIHKNSKLSRTV